VSRDTWNKNSHPSFHLQDEKGDETKAGPKKKEEKVYEEGNKQKKCLLVRKW
jgi:hypothetical protein